MLKNEVIVDQKDNGVAIIKLNRPDALNSLNLNMVHKMNEYLNKWESDQNVKVIIIDSEGDRAFCAGGDMNVIYEGNKESSEKFFEAEYQLDQYIYDYPKPLVANLNGIVMGGGVGLTYGANYRLVTEKTRWAMPEVNLGFFPDVGAGYFLNKMPGYIGTFLALTGEIINGIDVLHAHAADYLIPANQIDDCIKDIIEEPNDYHVNTVNDQLEKKLLRFKQGYNNSELAKEESLINKHFGYNTIEKIMSSLKSDQSDFAQKYYRVLLDKSPVSLKVILKQLLEYQNKTINESLQMDRVLVSNFLNHDDFYEGIRSVLVDKDRNPVYEYSTLTDVSDLFVNQFFDE